MSTEILVRHCSPTLAGIKVGNLVSCKFTDKDEFLESIREKNKNFSSKGLFFKVLRLQGNCALVYVYRVKQLVELLRREDIQNFLSEYGYSDFDIVSAFDILENHLIKEDFPHEIGVFLGYPLEDVKGFIENKGENSLCVGHWKAYTNEEDAKKIFAKFKKCTCIYCKKYAEGFDINRLAVNA